MRRKITNLGIISLILLSLAPASLVNAHGERSQEPFLRMLSVQWYDTKWSTDKLAVNEEMTLTGKFHLLAGGYRQAGRCFHACLCPRTCLCS